MNIVIDARPLLSQEGYGGIPEFTRMLISFFVTEQDRHTIIIFLNSSKIHHRLQELLTDWGKKKHVILCTTRYPNKFFSASLKIIKKPLLDEFIAQKTGVQPDIFLAPNIDFFAFSSHVKKILVVHDLTFEFYPTLASFKKYWKYRCIKPQKCISLFDSIIVNSKQTQQDLIDTYLIQKENCIHIPFGIDPSFFSLVHHHTKKSSQRTILFLGAEELRKNFISVLEAWKSLVIDPSFHDVIVYVSGARSFEKKFQKIVKKYSLEKTVVFLGPLSWETRLSLFSSASLCVYPSIYEGFGFPPLEALACGTPVISAMNSSLGEVGGDAVFYIDPYNSESLARAISYVLVDPVATQERQERGHEWVQHYSFKKTGQTILNFIEKITSH